MKLHHLMTEETVEDYVSRLVKTLNIKQLGSGHYSSIFQHPAYHNVVVKLCRKQDPATIRYLKLASQHPDNPWFPKIVGIHTVRFHGLDSFESNELRYVTHIVFMQKLKTVTPSQYEKATKQLFKTLPATSFRLPMRPNQSGVRLTPQEREARNAIIETNKERTRIFPPLDDIDTLEDCDVSDWKHFAQHSTDAHVRQLAQVLVQVKANDIHWDNLMKRDDGSFVITDPVAS